MNEGEFIRKIHAKIPRPPRDEDIWKVQDRSKGGIADCFYFSETGQLMVIEYKFLQAPPLRQATPKLSGMQRVWLRRRAEQGFWTVVVVGTKTKCAIINSPDVWEKPIKAKEFMYDRADVVRLVQTWLERGEFVRSCST